MCHLKRRVSYDTDKYNGAYQVRIIFHALCQFSYNIVHYRCAKFSKIVRAGLELWHERQGSLLRDNVHTHFVMLIGSLTIVGGWIKRQANMGKWPKQNRFVFACQETHDRLCSSGVKICLAHYIERQSINISCSE